MDKVDFVKKQLAAFMRDKPMTLTALSEQSKVSRRTLHNISRGTYDMRQDTLNKLFAHFTK
jgi:lambda repressor-like predicted transcriptional regulator